MSDFADPVPEPATPDAPTSPVVLDKTQRYALVALGGLALVAVALAAVLRNRRAHTLVGVIDLPPEGPARQADIVASLRHLAAAVDGRLQGLQQQLDALNQHVGLAGTLPEPSQTVGGFSFGEVGPSGNGVASNLTYEQATADQSENIPPSPAATSLP